MSHRGDPKKRPKDYDKTQSRIIYSIIGVIAVAAIIFFILALRTHG